MADTNQISVARVMDLWKRASLYQRLALSFAVLAFILVALGVGILSARDSKESIYQSALSPEDYLRVTQQLGEWNISFDTSQDQYILVNDRDTATTLRMRLGQAGIVPNAVKGWELFDVQKFTTTDFERDVNLRRAIIGEMTKHLRTLNDVEDVSIQVSFPKDTLYADYQQEITASVVVTPAPYSDMGSDKQKVQGIVNLVAYGIPGLKNENVVMVDDRGNILSDMLAPNDAADDIEIAKQQLRIVERERAKLIARVRQVLLQSLPDDRFAVSADVEFDWTRRTQESKELLPTILKEDNPLTPYDDSERVLEVPVSLETVKENYQGPAYIPEGPAGVDENVPPGLKEKIDRFNKYTKDQDTKNLETGTRAVQEEKSPYEIKRLSVSVALDGVWTIARDNEGVDILSNGEVVRSYEPVSPEEEQVFTELVRGSVGYDARRGDQVVVRHVQFDRAKEFSLYADAVRRRLLIRQMIIAVGILLILLILGALLMRIVSRELEKRRQAREQEALRQQQAMREAALASAAGSVGGVELSLEERASMELVESVLSLCRERPEDVARLMTTWLAED